MWDPIDLAVWNRVDVAQERSPVGAHDDEALGELSQLLHRGALVRVGLGEDRVKSRHDRHAKLAKQREDVAAGLAAEDSVLVLQAQDVDGIDVQEVRRTTVRREVALADLEADPVRVGVTLAGVVHREHEAVELGNSEASASPRSLVKRGDPALARQVIAEHRDAEAGADDGVDGSSL